MDKANYQAALDVFKRTLNEYTAGWANAEARSAMLNRLADIKLSAGDDLRVDGYFSEHAHKIERYIDELYSPRKHLKYESGSGSGVEELKRRILSSLHRLETFPSMHARIRGVPE
jgi:hypothetical protein